MALQVTGIERKFMLILKDNNIELSDPNPIWTPERVMSFYEDIHPELTTSTVANKGIINDLLLYEFTSTVGVKG